MASMEGACIEGIFACFAKHIVLVPLLMVVRTYLFNLGRVCLVEYNDVLFLERKDT